MTLAQLRALVAVEQTRSFTAAADALVMTQSAVSHAVRALERDLGVQLVARGSQGAEMTAAGDAVVRRAQAILTHAAALRQEASAVLGELAGRLRIGTVPSANARLLPRILGSFSRRLPDVQTTLMEGSDSEVLHWLATNAVDVAIVGNCSEETPGFRVARDELKAVVPAAHPLADRQTISLAALAGMPFVMSSGGCEPLVSALAHERGVGLRVHYEIRDPASLLAMVAEGLGATIMPGLALPAPLPGVRAISLAPPAYRNVSLVMPSDTHATPAAEAFATEARTWTREHDPLAA